MDEIPKEEIKTENEVDKNSSSLRNIENENHELNEEITEMKENENEINNTNNDNFGLLKDKIENNISEINSKHEENDSLLQKEINDINLNEETEKEKNNKEEKSKISKKTENKVINSRKKSKKSTTINKEEIKYSQNRFHKEKILNYIKEKERKEKEECYFKPKINKKIGFEVHQLINDKDENDENAANQNKDVVERLLLWKERVKQKLLNSIKDKQEKEENERDNYTFSPKLKTEVPKFDKKEVIGTDKYYKRIKISRELKKQKENKLNPNYDELYDKYYKNKEKTVLQKNKKVTNKTYKNYLNHFHNVLMNDDD